ncbi:hypothetical protein SAY86_023859 [Trapa natans]|uniref:Uncharacterized protein n=1 Tax=Trapa natans TaxID=22666 RepID=A0AAN7LY26_TRANT|nr:hypothetical protein SAY86_023859 [Trapa natans]
MEKDSLRSSSNGTPSRSGGAEGLLRSSLLEGTVRQTTTTDFVLQWGNRKRLRCMKVQVKDDSVANAHRTTARVDRRVVRTDRDLGQHGAASTNTNHGGVGYQNLRHRPCSPPIPPSQRVLRNSENSAAMRGHSNGGLRGFSSPDRGVQDRRATAHHHHNGHHHNESNRSGASSETAHDSKKGGGGGGGGSSSGGSGEAAAAGAPQVWPPKFVIALTNKEKEEDFIIFKGSKPPQRPKKRAKIVQRTVNLVCPGGWLCDLTLERYEVREKKISKKRPRGLKAMGNMDSDSE